MTRFIPTLPLGVADILDNIAQWKDFVITGAQPDARPGEAGLAGQAHSLC